MKKITTLLIAISFFSATFAQYTYPLTKTVDSADIYFGVTYKDHYRWLEYIKEPAVIAWFKQQANYTDSILNKLNGRAELIAEWKRLDGLEPALIYGLIYENGRVFYRKSMPGEKVGKIYYREGIKGPEQLLFDPTTYIPGKTLSVRNFNPSFDGKKLAIGYTEKGAELPVIKVMEVDTKQFLTDSIYPAFFSSWTFDNRSFLYGWIKTADIKDPTALLNSKTKLHVLGTDASGDVDFFSNASYPELKITPEAEPFTFVKESAKGYVFASLESSQSELMEYYAPIRQFNSKIQWKILCKESDSLVNILYINDEVYAISHKNASNNKVVKTSLKQLDWANATTIAAENADWTVRGFTYSKDYLVIVYSDGITGRATKYNFKTKTTSDIKLPFPGTVGIRCINSATNNCYVYLTSWNKPRTEFSYDLATGVYTPGNFNKTAVYPAVYNKLVLKEVEVKGHDGAMIPLSIIYREGLKMDGSNVCLMDGYGAYGIGQFPQFDDLLNSLAVRGVVIAMTHVRGGSEKGEAWYRGGFKTTKPNTWKDFISCAEYLITNGYTSPKKLAGQGTSAGGILISRAITERPDLFAAAICNVGVSNAMRMEFSSNGPANVPEFGTIKDSVECKALYEMDGMQHVEAGIKYPAVICIAGWNDPRVMAWEPGKFAAALQNASASGRPVLMKVNYDNGHFTEDKNVTYADFAGQYAFVLWQCGHPDFQINK